MNQEVIKFSESLSGSLEKLYRAGGFMLVFIFAGVLLMILGYLNPSGRLSALVFGIGASVIVSCLFFFFFLTLKGPVQATRVIKENKEVLDNIQAISISLTDNVSRFQALMLKHSEQVARIIDLGAPFLAQLPMLDQLTIAQTRNVNEWISNTTEKSQVIIRDIRHSLETADVKNLRKYAVDLEIFTQSMKETLSRQNELTARIPDYKGQIKNLQQQLISLSDTVSAVQKIALYYADNADWMLDIVNSLPPLPFINSALNRVDAPKLKRLSQEVKDLLLKSLQITNELKTSLENGNSQAMVEKLQELKIIGVQLEELLARK